jgi:hypothetical protein
LTKFVKFLTIYLFCQLVKFLTIYLFHIINYVDK